MFATSFKLWLHPQGFPQHQHFGGSREVLVRCSLYALVDPLYQFLPQQLTGIAQRSEDNKQILQQLGIEPMGVQRPFQRVAAVVQAASS